MRTFKDLIKWFIYITTGVLIVCAVNFAVVDVEAIPKDTLWHVLLSSFMTAFLTWLLCPTEENRKFVFLFRTFLHYVALCVVMVFFGNWFGWISLSLSGVMMMAVDVAIVYFISYMVYYLIDIKSAEEINKKLKEKYSDEE